MTESLSPKILALVAPLDAYAKAEEAAKAAERRYQAAKSALESYQATLGSNGHGKGDVLLDTLCEEMAARREGRQEKKKQQKAAAEWVRSVLAEAAAAEGLTDQAVSAEPAQVPESLSEPVAPQTEEEEASLNWHDDIVGGEPEGQEPEIAPQVSEAPEPTAEVEPAVEVEPTVEAQEPEVPESPVEPEAVTEGPIEVDDDEVSFEPLLDSDEGEAVDLDADPEPARADTEALPEPHAEKPPVEIEELDEDVAAVSDVPDEQADVEMDASEPEPQPAQSDDEDLWAGILSEEGEEDSFQPGAVA